MRIETEPCKDCDFTQCDCGRDIEDCMRFGGNRTVEIEVTPFNCFYESEMETIGIKQMHKYEKKTEKMLEKAQFNGVFGGLR